MQKVEVRDRNQETERQRQRQRQRDRARQSEKEREREKIIERLQSDFLNIWFFTYLFSLSELFALPYSSGKSFLKLLQLEIQLYFIDFYRACQFCGTSYSSFVFQIWSDNRACDHMDWVLGKMMLVLGFAPSVAWKDNFVSTSCH